ncbi:proprotein convertase P [Oscillochloris trichoides DG-6]|uniref:Proprotein convertase P n=1 Tax=Oscillochloris trichoides DG-6 TaxID=765420 RepID=E1IFL3_9CHLR|nr:VCBS repeat-containing protein [Oscillochloris trichoides]EFO80029.1 proprotein convertase P [Oscillochloris trichoides DG-6]
MKMLYLRRTIIPVLLLLMPLILTSAPPYASAQFAQTPFSLGWSALYSRTTYAVAWGDVDGDGDLDLAIANTTSPVELYLNSAGSLENLPIWSLQSARNTRSLAWGDVDGDGDLDLAVGNDTNLSLLFLNTGGQLESIPAWSSAFADATQSLVWGDVDNDGDLDLVVGNYNQPLRIYRNAGSTLETNPSWSSLATDPVRSVALGDVDGDGYLDLAVGAYSQNRLYENLGGTFNTEALWSSPYFLGDMTESVALGDVDNDGNLDLAVGNGGISGGSNRVYANIGGTLSTDPIWSSTEHDGTSSVAWGDVDSDGDLDLAVGNRGLNGEPNRLYENVGGTLGATAAWSSPEIDSTYSVAWGDLDGDGDLDLAAGNAGLSRIYLNQLGTLPRSATQTFASSDDTRSIALGDMDGDGDLDLAVGNNRQRLQVYANTNGVFNPTPIWSSADVLWATSIAWGDVDGDGDLDLAVGQDSKAVLLYRNSGVVLETTPIWASSEITNVRSVAWGDVDGDGDLDLAVGVWNGQNRLYLNNGTQLGTTATWVATLSEATSQIAWGDVDGDGDLDLAAGNAGRSSRLYRNDGGVLTRDPVWSSGWIDNTTSIAWGDVDGDGDLDLAIGNDESQPNRLYRNDGGILTNAPIWTSIEADTTSSIAWGDVDGDGDLDLAVGNRFAQSNRIYLNDHGHLTQSASWTATEQDFTYAITWGDVDNDGDLDLVTGTQMGEPVRVYQNQRNRSDGMGVVPTLVLTRPGTTANAAGYSVATIIQGPTIEVPYVLRHPRSLPVRRVRLEYSLDGGGRWLPAIPAAGSVTQNLASSPSGTPHTFVWDVYASGIMGRHDNVVLRMTALPDLRGVAGARRPGSFLFGGFSTTTNPFRVRGTQVRVVSAAHPNGEPGALVYHIPGDAARDPALFAPAPNQPSYTTDALGYLAGRGQLAAGDALVALVPIPPDQYPAPMQPFSDTLDLYMTNLHYTQEPTGLQLQGQPVTSGGIQTVQVDPERPLALINLVVSLEWDARSDERFMTQLRYNLMRTSELLFDATNGQVALGELHIFFAKENWDNAHIRIYASNRVRPNAVIGGIASQALTTAYTVNGQPNPISYGPGQIHIGATWNRYGDAGTNLAEDWPRVLAHELGHFLFFLDDHYVGRSGAALQAVEYDACPGIMHDPYSSTELHPSADWLGGRDPNCAVTLAHQVTGGSDWATLVTHYPALNAPIGTFGASDSLGPTTMDLPLTDLYEYTPLTPTVTLDSPVFYTQNRATSSRIQLGSRSRAYLFQDDASDPDTLPDNRIVALGRANLDQVVARGARVGDRVCVFEDRQEWVGCVTVSPGEERLPVTQWGTGGRPAWRPDIAVLPLTATTFQVRVGNLEPGLTLKAAFYQIENLPADMTWPDPITLNLAAGVYSGNFTLPGVLNNGLVHIWVEGEQPQREAVVQFFMDGNAGAGIRSTGGAGIRSTGGAGIRSTGGAGIRSTGGAGIRSTGGAGIRSTGGTFIRTGAAAVATSEADVLFEDPALTLGVGQFLLLQQIAAPPDPPAGTSFVGTSYRFAVSTSNPPAIGNDAAVSFSYMGSEVPTGEESGIRVYYYNPENPSAGWRLLDTKLNTYHNLASAKYQGPGIYALMSSLTVEMDPGWNSIAYPAQAARQVSDAMASADGKYHAVYYYNPTTPNNPWQLYSPDVPAWVNHLACMHYNQIYLVSLTSANTETLRFRNSLDPGETTGCPATPAGMAQIDADLQALGAAIPPATYYGTVVMQGVSAGMLVEARIGESICGTGSTQLVRDEVVYRVHVGGATVLAPGCGLPGRNVVFSISGVDVGNAAWTNDMIHQLDFMPDVVIYHNYLPLVMR